MSDTGNPDLVYCVVGTEWVSSFRCRAAQPSEPPCWLRCWSLLMAQPSHAVPCTVAIEKNAAVCSDPLQNHAVVLLERCYG